MITKAQSSILVAVIAQFVVVSGLDCISSGGITYELCGSGGSGKGSGIPHKDIPKCEDEIYIGGNRQGYSYSKTEFEIIITDITPNTGGNLLIKSFRCDPGNVCKIAVIPANVAVPIAIQMNKNKFVFVSQGNPLDVTFHVNDGCPPSCTTHGECPPGEWCCDSRCADETDDSCTTPCTTAAECEPRFKCCDSQCAISCYPSCTTHGECHPGEFCCNSLCADPTDESCATPCTTAAECEPDFKCCNSVCAPSCYPYCDTDGDCGAGEECCDDSMCSFSCPPGRK